MSALSVVDGKKLYKVLVGGKSAHGGSLEWSLPNGKPGDWHRYDGKPVICKSGIHLTTSPFKWYKHGCKVYEAEADGIVAWQDDKCVAQAARLLREAPWPKQWLRVEKFLDGIAAVQWMKPDGKPDPEWKLFTAPTRDAAGDAARDAAGDAARDAAWAAARDAAWAAAWDAAWDAARDAARDAAGDAARDAAGDAARDAAWAAARDAAWDAARDAARDAAGDAARDAAGDAARDAAWDADLMAIIELVRDTDIDRKHVEHAEARWRVWTKGYALYCDVGGVLYVYAKEEP